MATTKRDAMNLWDVKHKLEVILIRRSSTAQGKAAYHSLYQAVKALRDEIQKATETP